MDKIIVRETSPNVFEQLSIGESIRGKNDVLHSWQIVELWSDAELAAEHIYRVTPAPVPEGKVATGFTFELANGVVTQVLTLEDIVVPSPTVSPRQIRLAMTQMGLRQQVEDYVNDHDITVKDSWQYTTEFHIDHPLLQQTAFALGKTEAELRALFDLAASIP